MSSRLAYAVMAVVVGVALYAGATDDGGGRSLDSRVAAIAEEVRCPTCEGLSAAESETPASHAIRQEIRRRAAVGETDDEIRAFLVSRYGRDILLRPEGRGFSALVWGLPVAGGVAGLAGLALAFRRWRRQLVRRATDADRALVAQELAKS